MGKGKQKNALDITQSSGNKALASTVDVSFQHVRWVAKGVADFLAKVGVDTDHEFVVFC